MATTPVPTSRSEAYAQFLKALGIDPISDAPAHRIAFNVVWHAAIGAVREHDARIEREEADRGRE